jgi:hypothetical protein
MRPRAERALLLRKGQEVHALPSCWGQSWAGRFRTAFSRPEGRPSTNHDRPPAHVRHLGINEQATRPRKRSIETTPRARGIRLAGATVDLTTVDDYDAGCPRRSCCALSTVIGFSPAAAIEPPHRRTCFLPAGGLRFSPLGVARRSLRSRARGARRSGDRRAARVMRGASPPCRPSPGRAGSCPFRRSGGRARGAAGGRRSRSPASWASARRTRRGGCST